MSDSSVADALRSDARLIVVEAPAGCGKTYQGSKYARDAATQLQHARVLILAHTHAACDVFADRTRGCGGKVDVSTIDSLLCAVASAYHSSLGLPPDCGAWARKQTDGYRILAAKVIALLRHSKVVSVALARRYPIVICDEHQDATSDQHALAISCRDAGSKVRIFGDPMQSIYSTTKSEMAADQERWTTIVSSADSFEELDTPHRWHPKSKELGHWILETRKALRDGGQIDLTKKLPNEVSFVIAENQARDPRGYSFSGDGAKHIYAVVKKTSPLLILTPHNDTVNALRGLFNRSIPIWEGHVRDDLSVLADSLTANEGDASAVGSAMCTFLESVAKGCSPSALGNGLLNEIRTGCASTRRGRPASVQSLARMIVDKPNHCGVGRALRALRDLAGNDPAFNGIEIDYSREFWDAVRLGQFNTADEGLAELARRRTSVRPLPPPKAISTIHKAKGLECAHVVLMPCDSKHFSNTLASRFKMYVAISRAMSSLTFVVSRTKQSPLIKL